MAEIKAQDLTEAVQTPQEAVYALFLGASNATFDADKLTVVSCSSAVVDNIKVVAAIIGESHFVQLIRQADGTVIFTEILACVNPVGLGFVPDICCHLQDANSFKLDRCFEELGLQIIASVKIKPRTRSRRCYVPHVRRQQSPNSVVLRLKEAFPDVYGANLRPRTIVSVVFNQEVGLRIRTVHEYVTTDGYIEPLTTNTKVVLNQG